MLEARPFLKLSFGLAFSKFSGGCFCRTLSLKQCRKLLEEDLGLPEKGLNAFKELVQELVEKVTAWKFGIPFKRSLKEIC